MNGKIDRPRLSARALDEAEIRALEDPSFQGMRTAGVVGVWDFSRRMESESIEDISGNQLHGRTLNLPVRAMKGANWTGEEMNWRHAPAVRGDALSRRQRPRRRLGDRFLADRAGIAAVRPVRGPSALRRRRGVHPFVVRATPGQTGNRIAYLVPTASYMAMPTSTCPPTRRWRSC